MALPFSATYYCEQHVGLCLSVCSSVRLLPVYQKSLLCIVDDRTRWAAITAEASVTVSVNKIWLSKNCVHTLTTSMKLSQLIYHLPHFFSTGNDVARYLRLLVQTTTWAAMLAERMLFKVRFPNKGSIDLESDGGFGNDHWRASVWHHNFRSLLWSLLSKLCRLERCLQKFHFE